MEINARHWLIMIGFSVMAHGYVVWQLNFSEPPKTSDVLTRYVIDLTTFQSPPKPVKLEPFQPPVLKKTPPVATKPEIAPKPKPKSKPKPKPKPKPAPPPLSLPPSLPSSLPSSLPHTACPDSSISCVPGISL